VPEQAFSAQNRMLRQWASEERSSRDRGNQQPLPFFCLLTDWQHRAHGGLDWLYSKKISLSFKLAEFANETFNTSIISPQTRDCCNGSSHLFHVKSA
jgi:hypothetical protein